ncbi:hypothetical protein [Geodermatophilus aquaeductus]|nr:hypothetical protein [Geodermatophilus aquaeductus]
MSNTETVVPKGYELKKKKPIFKKVWFWLLVIVAIAIIATVAGGGGGESASAPGTSESAPADGSTAEAPAQDDPLSDGGWTASDIQLERTQFGDSITARVTNNEDSAATGIFTLTVFGPDGARIGEVTGSANEVEPGQAATVTFIGTTENLPGDPATYTYEFQNDL